MRHALRFVSRWLLGLCLLALVVLFIPFFLLWLGAALLWEKSRRGKRLQDPVFGSVTYDGASSWTADKQHVFEALGGPFAINVTAPRARGPSAAQRDLLLGVIARQRDIRAQVEGVLYEDYQLFAAHDEDGHESLPQLQEPADIWRFLSPGAIFIEDQPGRFAISLGCTWDEEHGLDLTFKDWVLQRDER